ncbi:phosphohydrolase [Curvibacter sp. APW13]|uniref:HD-GYP domain-containing protein n=1 Tax=Curvibacter sp. APW13 TaxID=3077236 RepID=UPI0028DD8A4B|nr:phosphohydrolase [Curvibacter sp. APW13]MDT8990129.1 phosphohydrolase [Curvibacter sp. APW13]
MQLVPISVDSIRIAHPLPFPLMDKDGVLIAKRGYVVPSREDLLEYSGRNGGLFIDVADSEAHHKAYVERLQTMVREDKAIGEIASTKLSLSRDVERFEEPPERLDWLDLQFQANALALESQPEYFLQRLDKLSAQLQQNCQDMADGTLFALMYLSASDSRMYSATHGMLVATMCQLAARDVLKWPQHEVDVLCRAALTMNIGMSQVQDQLALQKEPPTAAQRKIIDEHAQRSVHALERLGIDSQDWLDVVRNHHQQIPGPLSTRSPSERMTRLIQRADMFAAKLAPRASRHPIAPASAMQSCYFDENRQVDEAGAALIKAVGVYPPGTFVRLVNDETAVVVRRGANTTMPKAAVLLNRQGMPTVEHTIRDTSQREHRVASSVAYREVRVRLYLNRMLALTLPGAIPVRMAP